MLTIKDTRVPIWDYKVRFIVFDDIKEVSKKYNIDSEDTTDSFVYTTGKGVSMLAVPPDNISWIVHECEHLKNDILLFKGHKPDYKNDEVDAYLIEWIFGQVLDITTKHQDKLKKKRKK